MRAQRAGAVLRLLFLVLLLAGPALFPALFAACRDTNAPTEAARHGLIASQNAGSRDGLRGRA